MPVIKFAGEFAKGDLVKLGGSANLYRVVVPEYGKYVVIREETDIMELRAVSAHSLSHWKPEPEKTQELLAMVVKARELKQGDLIFVGSVAAVVDELNDDLNRDVSKVWVTLKDGRKIKMGAYQEITIERKVEVIGG